MMDKNTERILSDLEKGYDMVADKFSSTRAFIWRDLEFVRDLVDSEDKILDFGCGNGRLAGYLRDRYQEYIGVDISGKLIDIAKQKYNSEKTKFIKINSETARLSFDDNYFDIIFSIAVFHHFPDRRYALRVAEELRRVLKPGGKIVISVWNLWQKKFWKYHVRNLAKIGWGNIYVPFSDGKNNIFQRYHHAFGKRGLGKILEMAGFRIISCKNNFNIIYLAEKK